MTLHLSGCWGHIAMKIQFGYQENASRMAHYTKAKLADMTLAYVSADCSERFYAPKRKPPCHTFLELLHQRLYGIVSFSEDIQLRERTARTPASEDTVPGFPTSDSVRSEWQRHVRVLHSAPVVIKRRRFCCTIGLCMFLFTDTHKRYTFSSHLFVHR